MGKTATDIAAELKKVIRLAGRDPEALEGQLPALSLLHRVRAAGQLDEPERIHFILQHLIAEYRERLPPGPDGQAIRELLRWEDDDGELQSLTTRYHKAAAHIVHAPSDFGRRQEPRLLQQCARRFLAFDHADRLAAASPAGSVQSRPASRPDRPIAPATSPPAGIAKVHDRLDYQMLADDIKRAERILILNTWIPDLDVLQDALLHALERGRDVSIVMLHPDALITHPPGPAAPRRGAPARGENTLAVRGCLDVLSAIATTIDRRGSR
jgi:hypothetical protein